VSRSRLASAVCNHLRYHVKLRRGAVRAACISLPSLQPSIPSRRRKSPCRCNGQAYVGVDEMASISSVLILRDETPVTRMCSSRGSHTRHTTAGQLPRIRSVALARQVGESEALTAGANRFRNFWAGRTWRCAQGCHISEGENALTLLWGAGIEIVRVAVVVAAGLGLVAELKENLTQYSPSHRAMADVRVGQQTTTADGRNVGFYHTLATVCGLAQCCPWSHGVVERLVPQRRSLALALVLTLLSDAIFPLWPLGDLAACSSLQGRARLEASPSKTAINTGDRVHVCDGCGRPWREEASWTDYQCMLHPMSIPMSSSKPALLLTTTHSVTRWRAGIARCAADTSVLEQCATYRCHHCLTPTRLLLGGSSWYYGGANICGGTGAIFSTCMTGRHDRRAHLCRIRVAASAPSGRV